MAARAAARSGAAAGEQREPLVASLNYLAPMAEPLRTYTYDPPDGGPRFNGRLVAHRMTIRDARPLRASLALDRQGFVLCDHASAVRDFWDEDELRAVHYAEVERLVRDLTGAKRALVFDHTLRRRAPHRPPLDGTGGSFAAVREPVGRVHADYTPASAPARVRQLLGDAEAAAALARRYVIVGLWRPTLSEPLLDAPLAVCDARTVAPGDMVPNELVYRDRRGETCVGRHSPGHRWFWFPLQVRDEVIVFKNFDSAAGRDGIAGVVPHTAFDDPQTPADASPRASVELRAIAFFDD